MPVMQMTKLGMFIAILVLVFATVSVSAQEPYPPPEIQEAPAPEWLTFECFYTMTTHRGWIIWEEQPGFQGSSDGLVYVVDNYTNDLYIFSSIYWGAIGGDHYWYFDITPRLQSMTVSGYVCNQTQWCWWVLPDPIGAACNLGPQLQNIYLPLIKR